MLGCKSCLNLFLKLGKLSYNVYLGQGPKWFFPNLIFIWNIISLSLSLSAWHPGLSEQQHAALERIQKRVCRIILGNKYDSYVDALEQCKLTRLRSRREQICLQFMDKLMKNPAFCSWLPRSRGEDTGRSLRNSHLLSIPKARTERYARSPIPYMVRLWNAEASKV